MRRFLFLSLSPGPDFAALQEAVTTMNANFGLLSDQPIPRRKFIQFLKTEADMMKTRDLTKYLAPLYAVEVCMKRF